MIFSSAMKRAQNEACWKGIYEVSDVKGNDKNCFDEKSEAKIGVTGLSSIFTACTKTQLGLEVNLSETEFLAKQQSQMFSL